MKTMPVTGSMNLLTRLSRTVYRSATEDVIGDLLARRGKAA